MTEDHSFPSKGSLVLAFAFALFLASAFVPAKWLGVERKQEAPIDYTKFKSIQEFTKDTDNNRKLTWKEVISSTDEGAAMVAELKDQKPNPTVEKQLNDPNNLTASFSKNLYLTSTYLKNNNITDEQAQENAVSGITADVIAKTASKKYTFGEINVAKTEDKNTIRTYGNEIAKTLNNIVTRKNIEEDIPGLNSYLQTADMGDLAAIQEDAKRVATIRNKLITMSVPPSASVYHLATLNQVVAYSDMLSGLAFAIEDPIRAAAIIGNYPQTLLATVLVYKNLSAYFNIKNIVFSSKEAGYVFTTGYTLP